MVEYRATTLIPPLVKRAKNLARQMRFKGSCSNGTGRLLRLLSTQFQSGMIGEIGSGCGVGSAWVVSALAPGTSFITVEKEASHSAVVAALFESYSPVRAINGDWFDIVKFGPFNMVYISARRAAQCAPEVLLQSLRLGGILVVDGLVPLDQLSLEAKDHNDPIRNFWLNDPRLLATEIYVSTSESVILASRVE